MHQRQELISKIEAELERYCQQQVARSSEVGGSYLQLWQEITAYVMGGGKRIRPYLVLLAYEAYNGEHTKGAIQVAAAWELLHASVLIHDDIIDRDTVRHNKPNIAGRYEQIYKNVGSVDVVHYALSAALLAGDLLLAASQDIVNRSKVSPAKKTTVLGILQQAIYYVGGGELIDVESALYDIDSTDTHNIAYYKTATYSFQLPLRCGAELAGASAAEIQRLEQLGVELGIAFQMQDDLLGLYGSQEKTGKSNRSDLYEKKRTLLVQLAKAELSSTQAKRLEQLFTNEHIVSDADAEELFTMISSTSAKTQLEKQIEGRSHHAKELIAQLGISEEYKAVLSGLADKLATRSA